MTNQEPGREPLTRREVERVALTIAVAIVAWVFIAGWTVGNYLGAPDAVTYVVQFGGAFAVAMAIGWWGIVRQGPEGPIRARRRDSRPQRAATGKASAAGAGYLSSGGIALVVCVALLAQSEGDDAALRWAIAFGVVAAIQFGRYLRRRDS